jgi:transposase
VVGRPSKRTPEREARLLEALRAGNNRNAACHYAGITPETFSQWQHRFSEFSVAVQKAEADAQVRMVAQIAQSAHAGQWTAAAWWLERKFPDEWGRRDRIEITLRQQAEQLAAELGMDVAEVLAEAERIATR